MTAQGRWLPVTAAQHRHAQAGREAAEADWAAAAIKVSDELADANPYYRAAYRVRHHQLLKAGRAPKAQLAGPATASSAGHTVWCSDCSRADPCESCRAMLAARTNSYGSQATGITPDRIPVRADDASEPCNERGSA